MDSIAYGIRCANLILDSIRARSASSAIDKPRSDCCIAPLVRVGDDLYACSTCGALCSDGTLSMP
jgi:hypothetical protein